MPTVERAGRVELHWEERGEGPGLVLIPNWWTSIVNFGDLSADLVNDHRLITYDPRGNGRSTRVGPYDAETDADDLEAVLEAAGGAAVSLSWGDGCLRSVRVAARRPELLGAVVAWGNPIGPKAVEDTESMAASDSVLSGFAQLAKTNFRAAMRTLISSLNPQLDEEAARQRVDEMMEFCSQDAALARLQLSIVDGAPEECRALGERLWVLRFEANPILSEEVFERTQELAPEAHVETMADGAISRPDLTAAVVRKLTAAAREPA